MKRTDETWLITADSDELLMGLYEGMDRESAMKEFIGTHFANKPTFVIHVRRVGPVEKVQGTHRMSLELVAF